MPRTINEIRQKLRQKNPLTAGFDGEEYARKWMRSAEWDYIDVNQDKGNLAKALKSAGGKRPDFLIEGEGNTVIALDAEHKTIGYPAQFCLKTEEIEKYINLRDFIESQNNGRAEILFMLIPKESNGKIITFIDLNEFEGARMLDVGGDPAFCIDIFDRLNDPELTFDIV